MLRSYAGDSRTKGSVESRSPHSDSSPQDCSAHQFVWPPRPAALRIWALCCLLSNLAGGPRRKKALRDFPEGKEGSRTLRGHTKKPRVSGRVFGRPLCSETPRALSGASSFSLCRFGFVVKDTAASLAIAATLRRLGRQRHDMSALGAPPFPLSYLDANSMRQRITELIDLARLFPRLGCRRLAVGILLHRGKFSFKMPEIIGDASGNRK